MTQDVENRECVGLFGSLFGHKFKARCDLESEIPEYLVQAFYQCSLLESIKLLQKTKRTYVRDVCIRCGKIAENKQTETSSAKE